jgi:phage terminase large subunit-like protein
MSNVVPTYNSYIADVDGGRVVASRYIRQAVARWRALEARSDVYFDAFDVQRCIDFIALLRHFKSGKQVGRPFILEPWQQFIIATVIGWKRSDNDLRLHRRVFIELARKNGKTALAAALVLYLTFCSGRRGSAEGDLAANSKQQAKICFEFVNEFARQLDRRSARLCRFRDYITDKKSGSKLQTFAADDTKLDGFDASVFCLDEYHAAKNSRLYDVLASSQGSREEPLAIVITTAGFDKLSPCYEMRTTATEVLAGAKHDDTLAAFIFELDEGDDWSDPSVWVKANPNIGVTVSADYIAEQVQAAKNTPSAEVGVRTKVLNEWCDSAEVWLPDHYIVEATEDVRPEDLRHLDCYVGIDLSSTTDLACISALWCDGERYHVRNWYYLPEESLNENRFKILYGEWFRNGWLKLTPGNVTDYDIILNDLLELDKVCRIASVAYDSWNATQFVINATERHLPMEPYSQTIGSFNRPTKELERLLLSGRIAIDCNEINRHCFRNAALVRDAQGNIKVSKKHAEKKVDGVIAMCMALGAYLRDPRVSALLV